MNSYIHKIHNISLTNKYTNWYISIITKAIQRGRDRKHLKQQYGYVELHHILPKSFKCSDIDNTDNLVFLTAREHFLVHVCLTKMFTGIYKNKMVHALWRLKSKNQYQQHRYFNSKVYERIKRKNNQSGYTRLYKKTDVLYLPKEDTALQLQYINEGWSLTMTEEYKQGRVGNMKGKKHTDETKRKMSISGKRVPKPWLKQLTSEQYKARAKKSSITRKNKELLEPGIYDEGRRRTAEKRKKLLQSGIMSYKGANNPRYGATLSDDTKQKIAEKAERRFNNGYTLKELYEQYIILHLDKTFKEISKILTQQGFNKTPYWVKQIITKYRK